MVGPVVAGEPAAGDAGSPRSAVKELPSSVESASPLVRPNNSELPERPPATSTLWPLRRVRAGVVFVLIFPAIASHVESHLGTVAMSSCSGIAIRR
ncbi:hypothetical protein CF165_39725 [Amycolatopsis vastitatis]|uniref:Uncharacterized protein n=1 Tax=Amycolatopsis vastitatis TaxID=1905142 RepID=A0A229SRD7_9PSEU|nr:hypothetical protein CF165_39725 [Amycolatopsis vastitatis]